MAEAKKPKKLIIWVLVLLIGILAGLGIVFNKQIISWWQSRGRDKSLGIKEEEKEKFSFDWALWEDAAGFSFEYPRGLEIDVHSDDDINYSFLTLTSKEREGKIDIICNDSQYQTIEEWAEEDSLVKAGNALETEVASISGQRVALGGGREITAFIDWDEVIYVFDKTPEKELDFWNEIYARIISSFKLIPLEGESEEEFSQWLEGFDTVGVDVVEPVEIIEQEDAD